MQHTSVKYEQDKYEQSKDITMHSHKEHGDLFAGGAI